MDRVALFTAAQRRELFQETAAQLGMSPAVVEKDFWVCWVLKQLFSEPDLSSRMVFKGGTTLSKVFGLIDRFSEDIDLILDWQLLGYGTGLTDPNQEFASISKRDRFNKAVNQKAAQYIAGTLIPDLNRIVARFPQVTAAVDVGDQIQQSLTLQDLAGVAYKRAEQLEFERCKVDRPPCPTQFAALEIHLQVAEAIDPRLFLFGAPQCRFYTGPQFSRAERLSDVIVRPEFQPHHFLGFLGFGGQHDDRRLEASTPQFTADFKAILPRQHQVQQDQVELLPLRPL